MRRKLWSIGIALGLTGMLANTAAAQGVELGADVGLGYTSVGGLDIFEIATPTSLRVGFPVGDRAQVEPRVNLAIVQGDIELTSLSITPAIMFGMSGDRERGMYLAALPGLSLTDFGDGSSTQFLLGGGIGWRIPQGDRLGLRVEGQYVHGFENDEAFGTDQIRALFGVSFRTR